MNPRIAEIVNPHLKRAEINKSKIRAEAERNRKDMPTLTPFINDMRKAFPGQIVRIKASENGHVVEWVKDAT